MQDPAAPAKAKGWPLLAITLLVLLLAGFLFLRWRKREDAPGIVKEPPPVAGTPEVKPPDPSKPVAVTPEKPPVPPTPADTEFDQKLKDYKKAVEAKQWDDAAAALAAAAKLKPGAPELKGAEEAIAEGRKKEEAERAELAQKAEQKRAMERAWAVVKEKIEKDRAADLWDAAIGSLDAFARENPDILRDEGYQRTSRDIRGFQAESDKYFKKDMAEAQKHFDAGRLGQAISTAEGALKYYPERTAAVRQFQDKLRELQFAKTMVRIPSTPCWIGSDDHADEKPLRQVKLAAFLIDKYEVTNEDYAGFCSATNREPPVHWMGRRVVPKGRERHPVVMVTWDDAAAYAKWAGKRLPTAEEWEIAARGPDKREFPWGSVFQEKEDKFSANCLEYWQYNKSAAPGTTPVEDFENGESLFGVAGMGGNVWEWTSTAAPAAGAKPPPEFRLLKGGSFMTPQRALRCANIYAEDPRLPHPDVGFRCVRDVK